MAKKINKHDIISDINDLNNAVSSVNSVTYGHSSNIPKSLDIDKFDYNADYINKDLADKAKITSHVALYNLSSTMSSQTKENYKNLYDIIKDESVTTSLQTLVGTHNMRFRQTLQDYEVVKRCIPQVHRVLMELKNNIKSPDGISNSVLNFKTPNFTTSNKIQMDKLIEKYKLNELTDKIILEYLIVGEKYLAVVPYTHIFDMLTDGKTLNECISEINTYSDQHTHSLLEASMINGCSNNINVLNENAENILSFSSKEQEGSNNKLPKLQSCDLQQGDALIKELLEQTEFINGASSYYKNLNINQLIYDYNDIQSSNNTMEKVYNNIKNSKNNISLNEATISDIDDGSLSTDELKKVYKQVSKDQKRFNSNSNVVDGLLSVDDVEKMKKTVNFKGCHLDELDPTRIIPFKVNKTLIGYFYVEELASKYDPAKGTGTIMDRINNTIYQRAVGEQKNSIESAIITEITDRLIKSIDSKFLINNMDDIDKIYEFVKENELYKKPKRVIFFHPDDIIEFKRPEGSIMKNCMFMAKLLILTILSNVITNVTKGGDRNYWYVKTGLSTDINGYVNSAIRAIKQNQIRYSDIGTINDVFNIIGSNVDVFVPESPDGDKPIDMEMVNGQNVDMNNEFIIWMIKSIIMSFGIPSVVIDQMDQIELAKTLSMTNLDMARAVMDEQSQLAAPFTKVIKSILYYEIPGINLTNFSASLNPPTSIITEMNKDMFQSIVDIAGGMSDLLFPSQGESDEDKLKRLFKLEYVRTNMPSLWNNVEELATTSKFKSVKEKLEKTISDLSDINQNENQNNM